MADPLSYLRIFADADGESRAVTCELVMNTSQFAPPAPPLDLSTSQVAEGFAMLRLPSNWQGDWHPSPYRQWLFFMSGIASIEVSTGAMHHVGPGSIVLLEDTHGRGHRTVVLEDEVVIASVKSGATSDA